MKAVIEGQVHELLGEPGPRQIHELYQPELPIPLLIETYPGELQDIYRANGRMSYAGIMCLSSISVRTAIGLIGGPSSELSRGALLGPYFVSTTGRIATQQRIFRGLGIWSPPLS